MLTASWLAAIAAPRPTMTVEPQAPSLQSDDSMPMHMLMPLKLPCCKSCYTAPMALE